MTDQLCAHAFTDLKEANDGHTYVVCEDCGCQLGEYPLAEED